MSTSTSTAPPSALGECVVCGKESSTRCGTCLQGGVSWMFFCSREHQKLVGLERSQACMWKKTSNWPPFQQKEREDMFKLSKVPMRGPAGMTTWLESFNTRITTQIVNVKGQVGSAENFFQSYIEALPRQGDSSQTGQGLLFGYRSSAYGVKITSGVFLNECYEYGEIHKLIEDDPLGFLAYTETQYLEGFPKLFDLEWYSELQHRLLILISILIVHHRSIVPIDEVTLRQCSHYLTNSMNQFKKLARNVIRVTPSHPKEAKAIVETLIPGLMRDAGSSMGDSEGTPWKRFLSLDNDVKLKSKGLVVTGGPDGGISVSAKQT